MTEQATDKKLFFVSLLSRTHFFYFLFSLGTFSMRYGVDTTKIIVSDGTLASWQKLFLKIVGVTCISVADYIEMYVPSRMQKISKEIVALVNRKKLIPQALKILIFAFPPSNSFMFVDTDVLFLKKINLLQQPVNQNNKSYGGIYTDNLIIGNSTLEETIKFRELMGISSPFSHINAGQYINFNSSNQDRLLLSFLKIWISLHKKDSGVQKFIEVIFLDEHFLSWLAMHHEMEILEKSDYEVTLKKQSIGKRKSSAKIVHFAYQSKSNMFRYLI